MIQAQSDTDWKEMYQVFNMGHRLEMYVNEDLAKPLIDMAAAFGIEARVVGRVEGSDQKEVQIRSDKGNFSY
jgi:phosphoribosylformylglycinamidine cyclo-ligase